MTSTSPPKVLILGGRQVRELLGMSEALKAVERAFILAAEGKTLMPSKLYLDLPDFKGDFRAMLAYIEGAAGVKWVSVYPDNLARGLRSVIGTIILSDPATGYPLAVMDGTHITSMRTGAAGGIAAKYLARKNSTSVGIIGCGTQARTQLMAISEVLPRVKLVKAFDVRRSAADGFAREMSEKLDIRVRGVDTVAEAADTDIIVATTPARAPIIVKEHVRPGTHINAIGADAKGKEELEPALLKGAVIVTDDIEQASHSGEINVPFSQGIITLADIRGTLGEIITGKKQGRTSDKDITVFDSTGLAIEDIACARLVYEKAKSRPDCTYVELSD